VRCAVVVAGLVVALAAPSAVLAHGGGGGGGYTSSVVRIVNSGGVTATANADGHFVLTAPAGKIVIVHGYQKEPYLRFEGGKVYANERSPTTYVNREARPPRTASPDSRPRWIEQHDGRTYTWHDLRTHWTATEAPASVRRDGHQPHHVSDWTVDGTVDGSPFVIHGSLDWASGKGGSGYEWISYVAIGGFMCYLAYILVTRMSSTR
jgi:hypothetical protein